MSEIDKAWLSNTYATFLRQGVTPEEADDLTQATAEKMVRYKQYAIRYQKYIERSVLVDHIRKEKNRKREVSLESGIFFDAEQRLPELQAESPEDIFVAKEITQREKIVVDQALREIPKKQKAALRGYVMEERTYIEL